MQRFLNKVVLITGGNSGIGRATAKLFKEAGAQVIITGRDNATLQSAVKELGVVSIKSDVGRLDDIDALMEQIKTQFGRIDILFVNAGIAKFTPLAEMTEKEFDRIMNINVKGAYFTVQKALPLLAQNAAIVLSASIAAQTGVPGASVYAASKAAVRSFARTMSAELIGKGIRVNVVSPGPIDTPIYERKDGLDTGKKLLDDFTTMVPMRRAGRAEEVAKAVAFLASDDASYILGIDIVIDGGIVEL